MGVKPRNIFQHKLTGKCPLLLFQTVLYIYNGQTPISQNLNMKTSPFLLMALQLGEFICYYILHSYVATHQQQMLDSSVISIDTYKSRKKIHLFSMAGQLHGFLVELFYIVCMLSYRFLGKKFVLSNR
jgi:hypothetical protein